MRGVFMFRLLSFRLSHCLYFLASPAVLVLLLLSIIGRASPAAALPDPRAQVAAAYLTERGWAVDVASCEYAEVTIPERFGEVYRQYNALQKTQGFDLTPYRGRRAARFTFALTENPFPEEAGPVRANVLFVEDAVVAADLCSVGMNGFIRGVGNTAPGA